jgi:hypothetical protein
MNPFTGQYESDLYTMVTFCVSAVLTPEFAKVAAATDAVTLVAASRPMIRTLLRFVIIKSSGYA